MRVLVLVELADSLFLQAGQLSLDKLDSLGEVLAAVLELTLHLAAASQVVTDDRFVIRVKRVRVLRLNHYFVRLQKSLHASVPLDLILRVQFLYRLLVETGQQTHQLFVPLYGILVA